MKSKRKSSLFEYLAIIFKWRKNFILTFFSIISLAVIISLLTVVRYTATTTILPPSSQQNDLLGLMGASIASNMGGFSGLAGMLPGATTTSDLFAAILQSASIKGKVIEKLNLKDIFKTKTAYDTHKMLTEITKIRVSPEGIISISITWLDRNIAADIANAYVDELDKFNTETAMTTSRKYRIFIEERLQATIDTLKQAEDLFRAFQEKHHTIALDVEIENAISTLAELRGQVILLEVQKGVLASTSNLNNPRLYEINKELKELKKQLSSIETGGTSSDTTSFGAGFSVPFSQLPEVSLEYIRLYRDVKIQETVYELLTQQYEQAKIMEVKDTPTVQVLDRASPPERKSVPKRKQIVILAAFFGLICGVCVSFAMEWFEQLKSRSQDYLMLVNMYNQLKTDSQKAFSKFLQLIGLKKR
jgi:tyrosine-protein kinase Etk/Wzc